MTSNASVPAHTYPLIPAMGLVGAYTNTHKPLMDPYWYSRLTGSNGVWHFIQGNVGTTGVHVSAWYFVTIMCLTMLYSPIIWYYYLDYHREVTKQFISLYRGTSSRAKLLEQRRNSDRKIRLKQLRLHRARQQGDFKISVHWSCDFEIIILGTSISVEESDVGNDSVGREQEIETGEETDDFIVENNTILRVRSTFPCPRGYGNIYWCKGSCSG